MEVFVNFSQLPKNQQNMYELTSPFEEDVLMNEIIEFNRESNLLPNDPNGLAEITFFYPDIVNSMDDTLHTNLIFSIVSPVYMKGGELVNTPHNDIPFSLVFIIIESEDEDFPLNKEEFVMMFIVENTLDISDFD